MTVYKHGLHADLNETYLVGEVAESSKFLVTKAYEALMKAIEICKPGTMYREIGNTISKYLDNTGYLPLHTVWPSTAPTAATASVLCSTAPPTCPTTPATRPQGS